METFRDIVLEFRPQHLGVAFPINMLVNTFAMWFVVNHLFNTGEKESIRKCALCAILLYAISTGAIYLMVFPTALVFGLAVVTWMVLSVIVIHAIFELHLGGGAVLILYILILVGVHQLVRVIMG